MRKGDFKDTVKQQPGSAGVVQAVGTDRQGIGYSGIGYRTSDVRAVPLAKTENDKLVEPTFENALNKTYPLGRTLYHLCGQEARRTADPVGQGIPEVRPLQARPGDRHQGRLRAVARQDDREEY